MLTDDEKKVFFQSPVWRNHTDRLLTSNPISDHGGASKEDGFLDNTILKSEIIQNKLKEQKRKESVKNVAKRKAEAPGTIRAVSQESSEQLVPPTTKRQRSAPSSLPHNDTPLSHPEEKRPAMDVEAEEGRKQLDPYAAEWLPWQNAGRKTRKKHKKT